MKKSVFSLIAVLCAIILTAKELPIAANNGKVHSGRFIAIDGSIPNGPASSLIIETQNDLLKITITSRRQKGWTPNIHGSKNDDVKMFMGETAEVFLMPDNSKDYYHFALNPGNNIYTARNRDLSWEPPVPVKHTTRIDKNQWQAYWEIPFAALYTTRPRKAQVWRANFAISTYRNGLRRQSSWSGAVNYHDYREFGRLCFNAPEKIRIKSWNVENNTLYANFFIPEHLQKNAIFTCIADGRLHQQKSPDLVLPLTGKELNPKGISALELGVKINGKNVFKQRSVAAYNLPGKFTLSRFYVTPSTPDVRYQCDLTPPVRLRLYRENKLLKELSDVPAGGLLPLNDITPGRIIVEAKSMKDQIFARRLLIVCGRELSPEPLAPGGPALDGRRLRIGGKPVFLISGGSAHRRHHHAEEIFNLDTANYGIMKNAAVLRRFPYSRLIKTPTVGYVMHNDWQEKIDQAVTSAPPQQMHRISYEAHLDIYFHKNGKLERYDSAPFIKNVYDYVKKKYPDRIYTLQCDHSTRLGDFKDSCDVLEGAFWGSSYAENPLANILRDMQMLRDLTPDKPAIYWLGVSIPKAEVRVAEEVRAGVYTAVFNDMAGVVFHMGHSGVPKERSRLWSVISGINAEISQWYPGYAQGTKLNDFIYQCDGQFMTRAWMFEGKIYVGVVNLSAGRQFLNLRCKKGIIRDEFIAYDAKIYCLY